MVFFRPLYLGSRSSYPLPAALSRSDQAECLQLKLFGYGLDKLGVVRVNAQILVVGVISNRFMVDILIAIEWLNNLLLPFSLRLIHDLAVDLEPISHA